MSRTAQHLHVSQPAVSQQLSCFQDECGVQLFYRQTDGYHLTPTGEALFLLSKRVFSRVRQIQDILDEAGKSAKENLRIGTTKTYARTVMPDLIDLFQEKFPKVHVRLSEGNSADLIRRVAKRDEDLVVVARTQYGSSLKAVPFARCDFVLVASPDHPLAQRGAVSITSLGGETMVIRERGSGSRNAILDKLNRFGVNPSMVVESESLNFILAYIERRKGVSFMLSHEVEDELAEGLLRQITLEEGNISFHTDIVTRRNESLSIPIRHFLRLARKYGARLPAAPTEEPVP
jgi:DNA-binding transcriptional LysR family regulator